MFQRNDLIKKLIVATGPDEDHRSAVNQVELYSADCPLHPLTKLRRKNPLSKGVLSHTLADRFVHMLF